jgi:GNAT superfamily N-acetyltransferase
MWWPNIVLKFKIFFDRRHSFYIWKNIVMIFIRKGTKKDISSLLNLIKELAEYEKEPDEVVVTEDQLLEDGFGKTKIFDFYVATEIGKVVGFALYYTKYSTWKGKCIYLEDLIVTKEYRGQGIGKQLFEEVLKVAKAKKTHRFEWQVLNWNEPAINFYKSTMQI